MRKNYFTAFSLFIFSLWSYGQNKQALLIGINDYYIEKGVISNQSLKGCVNDAKSIKELIVSRFGFQQKNIKELYNSDASRNNILSEMANLLARSNPGDNALIYYSGHGLLLDNSMGFQKDQAIVPSDIYQKYRSYILNQDLAAMFNKFVDKKVTLTVIFDCCYSWSVEFSRQEDWEIFNETDGSERWLPSLVYVDYTAYLTDTVYRYDSLSATYQQLVLDNSYPTDKVIRGLYELNRADSTYHLRLEDSLLEEKSIPNEGEDIKTQKIIQEIPSKRPNSNFLFLSATNGLEKGLERTDVNKNKHGVFTRALLDVLKQTTASISSNDLYSKIKEQLGKQFVQTQTPSMVGEQDRMQGNLLGVDNRTVINDLRITCTGNQNKTIFLNKGAAAGLTVGNVLMDLNAPLLSVEITELRGNDTAIAKIKTGNVNSIAKGHVFKVISWYTKSDPLIKVYIPNDSSTFLQLNAIVSKYIKKIDSTDARFLPFDKDEYLTSKIFIKGDYFTHRYKDMEVRAPLYQLNSATIQKVNKEDRYFIYLPVPIELSMAVQLKCVKDQNIQLVSNPTDADISFYCAYSRKQHGPVFVCSQETINVKNNGHKPSNYYIPASGNSTRAIANSIYKLLLEFASKRGWVNYDAKK